MVSANELKRKLNILLDGQPYAVLEIAFSSPSARGASTMVKAKVRHLLTGAVQDKTFRTNEKFDEADVEKVPASFLYIEGENYNFMDDASYEQFFLTAAQLEDSKGYLKEGIEGLQALKYNGRIVSLELPAAVELRITDTQPPIKGASASGRSTKKAILETGLEVQVPLYIESGTVVRVNTQTGDVTGRA